MYMQDKASGDMVEILDVNELINPNVDSVRGRLHAGEELQESDTFSKSKLQFPSGEPLPTCWTDAAYRKAG